MEEAFQGDDPSALSDAAVGLGKLRIKLTAEFNNV